MNKTIASVAVFLYIVISFSSVFGQEEKEHKTVVLVSFGVGSVQHEWDTGESEFHHPVSFLSAKIEHEFSKKFAGCLEILGQFALSKGSPNRGERLEIGGCVIYKPIKTVKLETSLTNYRTREYSVSKFAFLVSREFEFKKGSVEAYSNLMIFSGSGEHQKTGVLNKAGLLGVLKPAKTIKLVADFSVGRDNAPLEFEKPATTIFIKTRAEKKINDTLSLFGEWRLSKPFTETRHRVSSFQGGVTFHF